MSERSAERARPVLLLAGVAVAAVIIAACGDVSETASGGSTTAAPTSAPTTEPIIILSAEDVGPGAFTPPVDTAPLNGAPTGACDKQALINELAARPDAQREWAEVLSVPQDQVATYINTLQPATLGGDTRMTNHGLRDGAAFAVQATLTAGTAILVDTSGGQQRPVTRCKCGNPLLPPIQTAATTTTTFNGSTTSTFDTTTTTYYDTTTTYYYDDTTTTYYDEYPTTEYYPTASEPPYTEPEATYEIVPDDYEPVE